MKAYENEGCMKNEGHMKNEGRIGFGFRVYISERYIRLRDLDHIHGKIIGR